MDFFFIFISLISIIAAIIIPIALIVSVVSKNPETIKACHKAALAAVLVLILGFGTCVAVSGS